MIHTNKLALLGALGVIAVASSASGQAIDIPQTRMVPIGSPSAVDQYRGSAAAVRPRETSVYGDSSAYRQAPRYIETAYQQPAGVRQANVAYYSEPNPFDSAIRQTAMQQFEVPQLPANSQAPGNFAPPPSTAAPALPPSGPITSGPITSGPITSGPIRSSAPRGLPVSPGLPTTQGSFGSNPATLTPVPSSSDLVPLRQPQLGSGFATIDNCNCISAPSSYSASSVYGANSYGGCAPVNYQTPATYVAPPAQIAAPAVLPGGIAAPATRAAPAGALLSFGQELYPVQVGQGLLGQPKAYVPGQPIRNWLRYLTP